MTAKQPTKPTPETVRVHQTLWLLDKGIYGHLSEWTAQRFTIVELPRPGDPSPRLIASTKSGTVRAPFRWSEAHSAYVPATRTLTGELRPAWDQDVIHARKAATARRLRLDVQPVRGTIPEDPDAYVARVREAAEKAGTYLLRIQEGL